MSRISSEEGFTLLEVIVAVAIMAAAMGVLYPIFAATPGRVRASQERNLAVSELQSQMEKVLVTKNWQDLPSEGTFNGWEWRLTGDVFVHASDEPTSADFLFRLRGSISNENARFGPPIEFERVVVRNN
jgi:prepilin-type N-terminal cleavage/methylation domain-containing protein